MYYRLVGTLALLLYHTQILSMLTHIVRVPQRVVAHYAAVKRPIGLNNFRFYCTDHTDRRIKIAHALKQDIARCENVLEKARRNLDFLQDRWSYQDPIVSGAPSYDARARALQIEAIYTVRLKQLRKELDSLKH